MVANYICPVCGYPDLYEEAYRPSGEPSYEICSSCGYEFGKTDMDEHITFEQWREYWIENGMTWNGVSLPPANWSPREQLLNISLNSVVEYRADFAEINVYSPDVQGDAWQPVNARIDNYR